MKNKFCIKEKVLTWNASFWHHDFELGSKLANIEEREEEDSDEKDSDHKHGSHEDYSKLIRLGRNIGNNRNIYIYIEVLRLQVLN